MLACHPGVTSSFLGLQVVLAHILGLSTCSHTTSYGGIALQQAEQPKCWQWQMGICVHNIVNRCKSRGAVLKLRIDRYNLHVFRIARQWLRALIPNPPAVNSKQNAYKIWITSVETNATLVL